ncbi:MAG TPA: 1-(5-phosphoribosyl)-5-[(5-phosphoribosylamino)methylideneamino]imidazole-4-carboxamide isomerase [Rhodospirillaceae bacterium]|nr:1-(5-phosphoribosyl)-5-[(5-phosphoribosylamino)methylideneamino]imidazole-4-carboxamide isomerase [Alphaproteobacteria bacterium]OUT40986.1 MAG: 1-(5-phosphoribosyl)-5-[(5-phosphoribosylamino)methylideneamino]imidazole-4-carboxamide isomerase [Micavibrio sp. TMED2]HCI47166.1 1-(5-phosphoribosyl)-5-[(5-phosphoribosylamino)methylideneamino]imidazole-4-carboxamide isomerase [Rhodospirillaceae bacterium]MAS47526.1 1-(5-phosphoribosyl)-5-[(5-phosphoribosylamino)methylideneamino]imidazole-4-carboxa
MILYPAIDLKDGACVRLLRGDMTKVTVYNTDPADQAKQFAEDGFEWIHLVDLNGAVEGKAVNSDAVAAVVKAVDIPVQLGGGIRSMNSIETWIENGVSRVILGTIALREPELVKEACIEFPGKIAVGIDARDGLVAVSGWVETSEVKALDLALRYEDCGVSAIVYTDINRDGAMKGLNIDATADLAFALTTPVIASGGVSSLDDLRALKAESHTGIEGVISGKALYDGRIDPKMALNILKDRRQNG